MRLSNDMSLADLSQLCAHQLETTWRPYLQNIPSLELKDAMQYTLSNGGKRLRPLMIYATGCIFDTPVENLNIPACSVELIHTYSLIHDDLPSMDNADLRRGQPACHKAYTEGMAILTGDALHTLAMQILATHPAPLKADKRAEMLKVLSTACGPYGMAAGQALDISMMNDPTISNDLLLDIYKLKTGALFSASIELARVASGDDDEIHQRALTEFGQCIGLAFQIQDDILDTEGTTGKPKGIDIQNNKVTYPRLHGINAAKEKVEDLYQQGLEAINYLGQQAQLLRELVTNMLERKK